MSTFQALALALLATLPLACRSNSSSDADVPCRCGTELGDLEGCAHSACAAGKNNPDNPSCVCGMIDIPATKKD